MIRSFLWSQRRRARSIRAIVMISICAAGFACAPQADAGHDPKPASSGPAESIEIPSSLDALKDRSQYAALTRSAVEALVPLVQARWTEELSAFSYLRVEHFAAGGASHWMSIWSHDKTGLEFVLAPGGTFLMGSPANERARRDDELQHTMTLDPFLIARTECTQGAWSRVAEDAGLEGGTYNGSAELPVCGFSPADVQVWCRKAGLSFPTEAQWEYMCRAGTTSTWTMGADKQDLIRFANVGSAECPKTWIEMGITEAWLDGFADLPAEVATFAANAFGLFDVHGNLNEWCRDFYDDYEAPAQPGTGARAGNSRDRAARGGNFGGAADHARSAYRLNVGTGISPGGNKGFGFRPSVDLAF